MNKKEIIDAAKALKDRHFYEEALIIIEKLEPTLEVNSKPYTKLVRLRAECYYQNRELPTNTRFTKALSILETLNPEEGETKRLKGAIFKRKYQFGKNLEDLYRAITYYETAAQDVAEDEGYGAVNAVYLYYALMGHLDDALDIEKRRMYESKIEQITTNAITHLEKAYPSPESRKLEDREWISPTLAELYLSRYDYERCNNYLHESRYVENGKDLIEELVRTRPDLVMDIRDEVIKASKIDFGMNRKRFTTIEQLIKLYDLLPVHPLNDDEILKSLFNGVEGLSEIDNIISSVRIGKVGLALSGGGFRASLFHIGVLHRLAEMDILRHVQVISSVSGGSIIAMHYYLKLKRLLEENDNNKLEKADYIALVNDLREEFIAGVQTNIRMKAFSNKFTHLTEELGRQYQQELFDRTGMNVPMLMKQLLIHPKTGTKDQSNFKPDFNNFELKNKVPTLIINATNLNNGHNWRFTATGMGESRYMYDTTVDKNRVFLYSRYDRFSSDLEDITIGNAVAASSAVPGLFDPIELGDPYAQGDAIKLSDGGVYDNQGIAGLVDAECEIIITSDASGQLEFDKNPSIFRFDVLNKIRDILMNKTRDSEFKIAKELRRANRIKGLSILHLKDCFSVERIESSPSKWQKEEAEETPCKQIDLFETLDKKVQEKLAAIRTDLDAFHDLEAQALIQSGYEITAHWFETYGKDQEEWKYFDQDAKKEVCFDKLNETIEDCKEETLRILGISSNILFKYLKLTHMDTIVKWGMIGIIFFLLSSICFVFHISCITCIISNMAILGSLVMIIIGFYLISKEKLKKISNKLLYSVLRPLSKFYLNCFNDLYLKKGKIMKPLCFVLMPFGKKKDAKGREIDFNMIYDELIKPAIVAADMEPIRADEEMVGGIIHKPMFERLLMCEYAIADLSIENANVYYELGIRHAARPHSTLSIFNSDITLPFDVRPLRALPYHLDACQQLSDKEKNRVAITKWLNAARKPSTDSPLFQFFDDLKPHAIPHEKTDIFRERVQYSEDAKKTLFDLRQSKNFEGLKAFESSLKLDDTEGGILIDLFLSYRALDGWDEMIDLVEKMPEHLRRSLMVQEQLGFALNRAKRGPEAERVLLNAIETYGANSETCGILGRIYKDRWKNESDPVMQQAYLRLSIDMYVRGFESDWRDAYPGVNAVTLMTFLDTPDSRQGELLPVVRFAVNQKVAHGKPDYWDYATLMELEILSGNMEEAKEYLLKALPLADEAFMSKTTMDTLVAIQKKQGQTEYDSTILHALIDVLQKHYESLKTRNNA